LHQLKTE